ncbi:MAG: hypothetical protein PHD51_00645 [Patescibacteria group bacterium]|nr:hypothetical protein [Patescibacteria group bacterium]MDD5490625.1 hypothetical protein [Patescibacteria group bacterium]
MDINKFFQSKAFQYSFFAILALLILLAAFKAGTMVGFRKADFFCRWSDNYHQNFGGPRGGFGMGWSDKDFIEANGTFGQIIKIDAGTEPERIATLVIKGRGDVEKIILINGETVIKSLKETIQPAELKINDFLVAIGEPNDTGQIAAKLIRIMPTPPAERPLDIFPNKK